MSVIKTPSRWIGRDEEAVSSQGGLAEVARSLSSSARARGVELCLLAREGLGGERERWPSCDGSVSLSTPDQRSLAAGAQDCPERLSAVRIPSPRRPSPFCTRTAWPIDIRFVHVSSCSMSGADLVH